MHVPGRHLRPVELRLRRDESSGIHHLHRFSVHVNGRKVRLGCIGVTQQRRGQKVDRHPRGGPQIQTFQRNVWPHGTRWLAQLKPRTIEHAASTIDLAKGAVDLHEDGSGHVAVAHKSRGIGAPCAFAAVGLGHQTAAGKHHADQQQHVKT